MAGGALYAARPFARAAVRYRILVVAFVLAAAVGPLALLAAMLRAAPPALGGFTASTRNLLASSAAPALTVAAVVAATLLLGLAFDVVRLRRVKQRAVPLGSVEVRRARVGTSPTVATPTAIGYLHPAVVLPEGFRARVDASEWDAVLAHECAHLARGDDWAKAIQSAVVRIGWWMPGLWVLSRALDLERELASDERAACATGARRYAACLLRLATDRAADAVAPALWGRRSHVAIRVERLLRPVADGGPMVRAIALGASTAGAFAIVAVAVLSVPGAAVRVAAAVPHQAQAVAHAMLHHATHVAVRLRRPAAPATPRVISLAAPVASRPAVVVRPRSAAPPAPGVHSPRAATIAFVVPAPAAPRARAPVRRPRDLRPVPIRPQLLVAQTLTFVAPHRHCRTCFWPLRSPEDAVALQSATPPQPPGLPSAGASAVAADDPTTGPVDLGSGLLWYRLPSRVVQRP